MRKIKISPSDVKYLKIDVGPRYWEDSKINGVDDISWDEQKLGKQPNMPFAVYNEESSKRRKSDSYRWQLIIDLETMKVLGWPNGVKADVFYKVCDDGTYFLLDDKQNILDEKNCYVPRILSYVENVTLPAPYVATTVTINESVSAGACFPVPVQSVPPALRQSCCAVPQPLLWYR